MLPTFGRLPALMFPTLGRPPTLRFPALGWPPTFSWRADGWKAPAAARARWGVGCREIAAGLTPPPPAETFGRGALRDGVWLMAGWCRPPPKPPRPAPAPPRPAASADAGRSRAS